MPSWLTIKLLVLDFDGVLTDNKVYVDQDGAEAVRCSRSDSLGLEKIKEQGIEVLVLSKEKNPVVQKRCEKLKIQAIQALDDKLNVLKKETENRKLSPNEICYVGNDINDLECLSYAGTSCAVQDAHPQVLERVDFVTQQRGGEGAVREVCDKILDVRKA